MIPFVSLEEQMAYVKKRIEVLKEQELEQLYDTKSIEELKEELVKLQDQKLTQNHAQLTEPLTEAKEAQPNDLNTKQGNRIPEARQFEKRRRREKKS